MHPSRELPPFQRRLTYLHLPTEDYTQVYSYIYTLRKAVSDQLLCCQSEETHTSLYVGINPPPQNGYHTPVCAPGGGGAGHHFTTPA